MMDAKLADVDYDQLPKGYQERVLEPLKVKGLDVAFIGECQLRVLWLKEE